MLIVTITILPKIKVKCRKTVTSLLKVSTLYKEKKPWAAETFLSREGNFQPSTKNHFSRDQSFNPLLDIPL